MSLPPLNFSFPLIDKDGYASKPLQQWINGLSASFSAGTVTSVSGTGTVNGITLTGTVTTSGNLTLGGSLSAIDLETQVTGTLPVANGGTSLATLTANNVILGNGTSAPTFVDPGTSGNLLKSNGTTWVSATPAATADIQTFSADGTWTKPANCSVVIVELWSGGGSGANNTGPDTAFAGASGGEYVCYCFAASACGSTESVTIGQGGAAIANGVTAAGNDGGDTTFGSLATAVGGYGASLNSTAITNVPRSRLKTVSSGGLGSLLYTVMPQAGAGFTTAGGNTIYGGGGGGGTSGTTAGGTSEFGGAGGSGNDSAGVAAGNGSVPSGGGGSSENDGGSGAGGDGYARITSW